MPVPFTYNFCTLSNTFPTIFHISLPNDCWAIFSIKKTPKIFGFKNLMEEWREEKRKIFTFVKCKIASKIFGIIMLKPSLNFIRLLRVLFSSQQHLNWPAVDAV